MFTNEEKLFLEAISKMFSNNNEERKASEKNIQTWLQETYLQVLLSCNKFIVSEELPTNLRQYSCYLITLCTSISHYQDWQNINLEVKKSVQANALGLLGNKNPSIRQHACIMVTSIFEISVRDQGWPDLINILCGACNNDNIDFKIAAINTLGMIWEKLPKEPFSLDELALMENTLFNLLSQPKNEELALKCLNAFKYFVLYIKDKLTDLKYLEQTLMLVIKYCNSINNINTTEVVTKAVHLITQIILLAYDYAEGHFKNISEFFIQLAKGNDEELAVQAIIFFIEVSDDEINRRNNNFSYRKYIPSIWDILWGCIQYILNMGKKGDDDSYSRYDAVKSLITNLSILCDESVITDIFKYMAEKLNDSDPLKISSAIDAFGSLMETVHVQIIESVIPDSIDKMSNLFAKNNEQLSITLSWCFKRICTFHAFLVLENKNIFSFLITTVINLLKEPSISNKIKMNLCEIIYALASYIFNHGIQSWNSFSPFLQELLIILEGLAYSDKSYDANNNLSEKCFIAISALIECSHDKDKMLISLFMEQIYVRLGQAQDISKFNGNKDKIMFFQSMLCLLVQSLCKNSIHNLIQLDNKKIEEYFNIIENYFKMRSSVFEEGFMALSGLITLISDNQVENLLERIMVYIKYALTNYIDDQNCSTACISLLDLIHASKEKFYPYINEIYPLLNNIKKAEDAKKNILSLIIVVYSDMFTYIGDKIWDYHDEPMNYMTQILDFSKENNEKYLNNKIDPDEYNYFIKLNENVVDFIESVSGYLKDRDEIKTEEFKNYMPDIIEYLSIMMQNQMFNPSNDYLHSSLTFLCYFAQIYKKYLFKRIDDYTLQRIFQFANNSEDDNIIHLKDYLQNLIYAIKMQS